MSGARVVRSALGLLGWLGACYATSAVGAVASIRAQGFYRELVRPEWAPPPWVFGPVWTALYALMAVAAWLVWRERGWAGARVPLALFVAQLAVNALWTWLFFAWRLGALATAEIALLWVLLLVTLVRFWRVRPLAGVLLVPYLAWVTFATALSFAVWRLNPALLR